MKKAKLELTCEMTETESGDRYVYLRKGNRAFVSLFDSDAQQSKGWAEITIDMLNQFLDDLCTAGTNYITKKAWIPKGISGKRVRKTGAENGCGK